MSMDMKQHDLEPPLVLTVQDLAGVADLRNVASWKIIGSLNGTVIFSNAPASAVVDTVNHSLAVLTRPWVSGDTAKIGAMKIEAEATWPGGRVQTFPAVGTEVVNIHADLG